MNTPTPVLRPGVLYTAWDRYVCATLSCAGSSALYTGWTIGGAPVTPTTGRRGRRLVRLPRARPAHLRVREDHPREQLAGNDQLD